MNYSRGLTSWGEQEFSAEVSKCMRVWPHQNDTGGFFIAVASYDMGKTLDFISSKMVSNPHLPEKRKKEVDLKRRAFKDHVELTLDLATANSEPLNKVLFQINSDGRGYINQQIDRNLDFESQGLLRAQRNEVFFDCADGIGCDHSKP